MNLEREFEKLRGEVTGLLRRTPRYEAGSWTPLWTASTTNPVLGNGSLSGQYTLIGKRCWCDLWLVAGSTTTFGSGVWYFSQPFTSDGYHYIGVAKANKPGVANFVTAVRLASPTTIDLPVDNSTYITETIPVVWADGDSLNASWSYTIA
jgi:hypothetical protein